MKSPLPKPKNIRLRCKLLGNPKKGRQFLYTGVRIKDVGWADDNCGDAMVKYFASGLSCLTALKYYLSVVLRRCRGVAAYMDCGLTVLQRI